MLRALLHGLIVLVLTLLSQLGGIAWLIALACRRRVLVFVLSYAALSVSALWMAPLLGREPLPCRSQDALQVHSKLYCILNRQYVTPELTQVLTGLATEMDQAFPGTITQVLDASFPYITGFPLLPHLSHDDGRKADIAFYYADGDGYLPGVTRSPLGYFAFEPGVTDCPQNRLTLRWDMGWLQGQWPDYMLDTARMKAALLWLGADPRIDKIFVEPHLQARLAITGDKFRFQGCRAARHDDHIHIQL